ncbi:MAG TPA: hypothetical protein VNJ28_02465, partial [Candidatus Limnocylindrales bacterium]|nr:hypothetical protein [Candidatus Limnocylindrales bacterium]
MRVRRLVLRLLAVGLTAGWAVTAALVLVGYRPGGPIDLLVGLTALLPVAISASAIVWPPVARGRGAYLAIVWLALGAGLVLAPSLGMLAERIAARGPQTLLPSLEVGYPWLLALAATSLFAGLGLARRLLGETALRRRRLVRAVAFALGATVVSASLFAGAAIANDVALRDRPARSSRFGPTDPSAEPPACDGPLAVGPTARVDLRLEGDLDGRSLGAAQLRGRRAGDDFLWLADVATTRSLGQYGAA